MIKLWRKILHPLCRAADAKIILEIGAEYGASTKVLLQYVKNVGGHLHSIDPYPGFEAVQFAEDNKSYMTFHGDLSLNVIRHLPRVDVAMVDGDHNWYTVYNELKQLEEIHGKDPIAQPIIFVHDLGWPYGRRDLYYNPDTIPEEFRQPYEKKGILPNRTELVTDGGMNRWLCNAVHEGGSRNGVLTAVGDYLRDSALNWHFLHIPFYYGLGILVTKQRMFSNSGLQTLIARLTPTEESRSLIEQAEHLRCVDGVMMQAIAQRLKDAETRVGVLEAQLDNAR